MVERKVRTRVVFIFVKVKPGVYVQFFLYPYTLRLFGSGSASTGFGASDLEVLVIVDLQALGASGCSGRGSGRSTAPTSSFLRFRIKPK